MQKVNFEEALEILIREDQRYKRDAYLFLRDALDFTLKQRKKDKQAGNHVSGQQLLEGIRQYALGLYGPMVPTVFEYWGVQQGEDFGRMVFNLVRVGVFGKTDRDTMADFTGIYTFHDAFVVPYLPARQSRTLPTTARDLIAGSASSMPSAAPLAENEETRESSSRASKADPV